MLTLRINDSVPLLKDTEVVYILCISPRQFEHKLWTKGMESNVPKASWQETSRRDMYLQRASHRQGFVGKFLLCECAMAALCQGLLLSSRGFKNSRKRKSHLLTLTLKCLTFIIRHRVTLKKVIKDLCCIGQISQPAQESLFSNYSWWIWQSKAFHNRVVLILLQGSTQWCWSGRTCQQRKSTESFHWDKRSHYDDMYEGGGGKNMWIQMAFWESARRCPVETSSVWDF